MKISSINPMNFQGLWEHKSTGHRFDKGNNRLIFFDDFTYHPFADETQEEVEQVMTKERKTPILKHQLSETSTATIIVRNFKIGERLNIREEDYEQIQNMKKTTIGSDYMKYYEPLNEDPSEFKRNDE